MLVVVNILHVRKKSGEVEVLVHRMLGCLSGGAFKQQSVTAIQTELGLALEAKCMALSEQDPPKKCPLL